RAGPSAYFDHERLRHFAAWVCEQARNIALRPKVGACGALDVRDPAERWHLRASKELKIRCHSDPNTDDIRRPVNRITETVPLLIAESCLPVNEQLPRRMTCEIAVRGHGQRDEITRCGTVQVVAPRLRRIPRSDCSTENNAVARVEKHLCRAAGETGVLVSVIAFEHHSDIADAIADAVQLPGAA